MSTGALPGIVAASLTEWDDEVSFNIFADEAAEVVDGADETSPDGKNEVLFGDLDSAGMGHPDDSCTQETMYRFAGEGETKKRELEAGDIAGINKFY